MKSLFQKWDIILPSESGLKTNYALNGRHWCFFLYGTKIIQPNNEADVILLFYYNT